MRQKMQKKRVQKPKLGPAKRARKRVRGAFQGRRTSRFAGIYIYIFTYTYTVTYTYYNYLISILQNTVCCLSSVPCSATCTDDARLLAYTYRENVHACFPLSSAGKTPALLWKHCNDTNIHHINCCRICASTVLSATKLGANYMKTTWLFLHWILWLANQGKQQGCSLLILQEAVRFCSLPRLYASCLGWKACLEHDH